MAINLGKIEEINNKKTNNNYKNVNGLKISTIKNKSNSNSDKKNTWFQKGAFSDGYDFGDVTKSVLGTAGDVAVGFVKGVSDIGASAGKLGAAGIAQVADWIGQDEYAERVRNNIAGKNEKVNENLKKYTPSGVLEQADDKIDNSSLLGEKSDNITQGIGYYGGMTALQSVGVPWQVTAGVTSAGNEVSNAYANDATDLEAWLSAGISAGVEIGTEKISGGLKLPGTGKTLDKITGGLTNKIKSNTIKKLTQLGIDMASEGLEEVISGLGSAVGRKLTYMSEKELKELYSSEEALNEFINGALVAGITSGAGNLINNRIKSTSNTNSTPMQNISYSKENNSQSVYTYENTTNQKVNNLRKSASDYFNNSEQTHNFINNIEKIISDKNYNIVFDSNIQNNGKSVNAQIKTLNNGEVEIRINPNSSRSGEFLIMHEVTHAIENDSMKKLVMDYASKHSNFNAALESLKTTYGVDDVTSEVLADISGQLFGNQEFINNLSIEQPSIFKRIYNSIISLANKITGNTNEALFIRDLKNKWETAYRTQNNNLNQNAQYSIGGINAINQLQDSQFKIDALNSYQVAQNLQKQNVDNETIRQQTKWFQDKNGDWKFEFDDSKLEIKENVSLKENSTYKLEEVIEHNTLFKLYPELANYNVVFKNKKSNGSFSNEYKEISINNNLLHGESKELLGTILHETQHAIQHIEGFETGKSSKLSRKQYYESLGEIEADDTKQRFLREMDKNDRKAKAPKSSLKNPKHRNYDSYMANRKTFDKVKDNVYNLVKGVKTNDEIVEKNLPPNKKKNNSMVDGRGLLDSSSFSMQNNKWQSYLEKNYKSTGTRTNMQDIKLSSKNNTGSSTNENNDNQVKNKLLNPSEISNLKLEDANTTPKLPNVKRNKIGDGNSRFYENIRDKTNMLSDEQKKSILSEEEVQYYDKITNEESLNKAFERLEKNGQMESLNWFSKDSENANSTDVAEGWILLKQYADNNDADGMVAVAKKLREIGTKAGQTVQAFNIMERMTPEGMVKYAQSELSEAYEKMIKNKSKDWIDKHQSDFDLKPEEVAFIMETMKEVTTMEDSYDKRVKLAEIQKVMTDKLPPEKGAGIKSWMRISMLFNPKTQVRNIAGNAIIAPVNSFSDLFASGIDKLVSKKTGVRTTGTTNLKNYTKGFKKGLFESYNDFKKGINTRNIDGNRFELKQGRSFNNNNIIGKNLNRVDNLLSFMLDAGDRGFYEASFVNSINNQMVLNNTTEITQDMIDIATQEALSRTWQDNNNYTKFVLNVRNGLNKIKFGQYGLGDVLIPFAKTPANLTKAIIDYSPVGFVNTLISGNNLRKSISNGQYTAQMQHKFVQSLGKATAGTMLYVLGYALATAGIVSGESDDDKDVKNFLQNTLGINSYSIKIGDKSFTYDWAQPVAAPLSITANIVNSKSNKETALLEAIVGSLDSAGSILLEQSFMQSINDVLNNNDGFVSGLITEVLELPARAIPTLSKQIADMIDGTQRQTFEYDQPIKSAINYAKSKIPGLSKTLAPSVDTMGREIQKYGGKNNIFNVFLNPANVNTENISKSAEEIYRLYKETGDTTIMPRVAPYYVNKNNEKITLNSSQRAEYQKASGKIIEENIEELLKNNQYKNMSDLEKADIINNIVNYSYNIAQSEILGIEISQNYEKAYLYGKVGNVSDYYILKSQEFVADKDEDGNSISGSKKQKIVDYINSMNLSVANKAILIKFNGYSISDYDKQIIEYINNQKLSIEEKTQLLTKLGYTIKNGRVYW